LLTFAVVNDQVQGEMIQHLQRQVGGLKKGQATKSPKTLGEADEVSGGTVRLLALRVEFQRRPLSSQPFAAARSTFVTGHTTEETSANEPRMYLSKRTTSC
jgi:hypothetical protein